MEEANPFTEHPRSVVLPFDYKGKALPSFNVMIVTADKIALPSSTLYTVYFG